MYTRFSNFSTTYIQISWFKITCVLAFAKRINIGVTKISQAKNNDEIFRHIEISRMQIKIEKNLWYSKTKYICHTLKQMIYLELRGKTLYISSFWFPCLKHILMRVKIFMNTRRNPRFARVCSCQFNFQNDFWIQRRFYLLFDIL